MTARDVLLAAAVRIEVRGHCQGASERDGRCCVVGAFDRATGDAALHRKACDKLSGYLDLPGPSMPAVVAWNDAPGRTAAEVIAALRGAAGAQPFDPEDTLP